MGFLNFNEISSLISKWVQNESDGVVFSIDEGLVKKAINIVIYLHPKNEDEVFLQLCALNLLNAAIKTELYKDKLSYDLIKSNAAKLVVVFDNLKNDEVSYYYNRDEYCLYFKLGNIVFSFHHVPLTSEILKASFANPINWPGIRLQKIAQPLLNYTIKSIENDNDIKAIMEKNTSNIGATNIESEAQTFLVNENQDEGTSEDVVTLSTEHPNENLTIPNEERDNIAKRNDVERNQEALDILTGVQLGDNVEISTYGILRNGKISLLTKQFVQLDLTNNKSIRIRCDAISSIESVFPPQNNNPIDLSFANDILKDILVEEGLFSSSTIDTNATITIVESRRIWITTDDNNTGTCYKGSIIGYDKEKLVKGQRVFVFPFKKEKAYCVIMEMSYYEFYDIFEHLLSPSNKVSALKRSQILSMLTFIANIAKRNSHTELLKKVKGLKKQLKDLLSSVSSVDESIEELKQNDEDTEKESLNEKTNADENTFVDTESKSLDFDKETDESSCSPLSEEIYKPEITPIQGPKILGKIDLSEIGIPKKKKEVEENLTVTTDSNDFISIENSKDLLPSMGKIFSIGPSFGFIKPHNQEDNLYFRTTELISYVGIIEEPGIGDDVIYSIEHNPQGKPIAVCIHKQCTRDVIEDLVEKFHFNQKTCICLKKHIDDFDKYDSEIIENSKELVYYLNKVGVSLKMPFSPNNVEKLFAKKLSSDEYAKAIEFLIDEVIKNDPAKSYNLFLRSSSYAKTHKMYDVSKHLIEKALEVFKGEAGKIKYFNGLLQTIDSLSDRIEINENVLTNSLEISDHIFPFMPIYVRDAILDYKDFNGITPDKITIRTGLYKEKYMYELKNNIKQNNADDLLYLTMMKLQLAFHPKEYNPKDDISKFLVNRAKNILASGDETRYSVVRYLLRLAYRIKSFDKGLDYTVDLYLMTLSDYSAPEIEMYMRGANHYTFDGLLKNILANEVDNTLELTLLAESNSDIKNRIIKEYEKIGKSTDSFEEFPTIVNEVKKRQAQYYVDPAKNFMSFNNYLQSTAILLNEEMNIVKNDFVKIVSYVTDFNTGQKYNVILDAYNNIIQKIDAIIPNLKSHPTEMGYETILPSLNLLKKSVGDRFIEIEKRVNPTISIDVLESVELEEANTRELKIEIRNSGDSARNVHINRLKVSGDDLIEDNNIIVDVRLSAGEEKLINIELHLCDKALEEKAAEVEFEIGYDDIYIAIDQRKSENITIHKTIKFKNETFIEIENKFRQGASGTELGPGNSMFYGREKIINDIQQAILTGTKNQIAIYGQKRSGKSSLLNQIIGRLESDKYHSVICGKFSLLNWSEAKGEPVIWILKSIAESLCIGIHKHFHKAITKSVAKRYFDVEADAFDALRNFMEYINTIEELQNSHFVIFIDEFTFLYQLIKDGDVKDDFMRRWIALIETPGINLQTVIAAQDTLPHFMNESYASNCFNKFAKEPLSYLKKEEALQLIKNPIKEVNFHNHSEELIYDYTSGSAFFTQIFCTRLIDYLNEEKKSTVVGKDEIETVAERLCTGTHRLEKSTFECLTQEADGSDFKEEDNEKVLKAIAESTRAGGYVRIEDLNVDLSPDVLKSVIENLYTRRVISKQNEGYSINVKLYVKWKLNN